MVREKRRIKMALSCIVLSLCMLAVSMMYLKQQRSLTQSEPVFQQSEVLNLPEIEERVVELPMRVNAQKVMNYYDSSKSDAEKSMAVSEYEGVYRPSHSVCYSYDGKVFEVTAMAAGMVIDVYEDELMGRCVEVDHGNGLVITYQSLSSTPLHPDDIIMQYDLIGTAGENRYYAQLGIHAQITAHVNGQLVDPESLLQCKVSEIN